MRSRSALLLSCLLAACKHDDPSPATQDAAVEEDDAAIVVPALDPAKCGVATGDESPMTFDRAYMATGDKLEDKAFPLFAELEAKPELLERLRTDATLAAWAKARETKLTGAKSCADAACVEAAVAFSLADRTAAADATVIALGDALGPFVRDRLRASGKLNVDAARSDAELLRKAVVDELGWAENALAEGRALTKAQRDAAIDVALAGPSPKVYFQPLLGLSLSLVAANGRDEAVRYEPLVTGENAAALAAIGTIDWSKYPFAAIAVPGLGPTDLTTALSEGGRQRCDLAAARYRAGVAPLIVPSGGHVHPDRTKFSEAIEMKKYLVSIGVPASAIIVDPHARHTTTNLRNVSRLLLRYGVPAERPVLVTSDAFQSLYMNGPPFAQRCRDEIGHVPWRKLASLSINDSCMLPSRVALTVDARDVLDP